jgi:tetrapyrrole methylase family protein/MazG family protein
MSQIPVNTYEQSEVNSTFNTLVQVVQKLRGPNGCPWDKQQTHKSLTQYAIEEAHELAQAIDQLKSSASESKNSETNASLLSKSYPSEVVEELGDLLFQVLLHAEIGEQEGLFTLNDVMKTVTEKMIRRHPHVFGEVCVASADEVVKNWNIIKEKEKLNGKSNRSSETVHDSPFDQIPVSLPALIRSQKIGAKSVRYKFDWSKVSEVILKVDEELLELKEAIDHKTITDQQEELGDLLFTVAQLARHLNMDAEQSLRMANTKFEIRFMKMKEIVARENKDFSLLSTSELEIYWSLAKKSLMVDSPMNNSKKLSLNDGEKL